ncbi:DUF4176 domain-containing protein [Isobaculum melis]|uniref:DUF4176 domain-containing protein n=1 Tax=Isobaculum melis TaxID=142588 RepID=A0A1H9UJL6_9LACT|nr:DUF4176 domain-containing protein [Isobaculum melis]SES09384.1 hypothetical protein SAMN04488559_1332 [Isobaculum melis]
MNEFLAIGSIVYLKDSLKKVMITGRVMHIEENDEKKMYDYCGCIYPDGVDSNKMLVFNRVDVNSVVFKGYQDDDEIEMRKRMHLWLQENGYEDKKEDSKEGMNLEL